MLVVFFVYGLAFFFLGAAILLKQDKRSAVRLRSLLLLLAGFGLLHGASEWSDMFLALEASYFWICAATEDKKEGTSAFLEKRAPQFHGR